MRCTLTHADSSRAVTVTGFIRILHGVTRLRGRGCHRSRKWKGHSHKKDRSQAKCVYRAPPLGSPLTPSHSTGPKMGFLPLLSSIPLPTRSQSFQGNENRRHDATWVTYTARRHRTTLLFSSPLPSIAVPPARQRKHAITEDLNQDSQSQLPALAASPALCLGGGRFLIRCEVRTPSESILFILFNLMNERPKR